MSSAKNNLPGEPMVCLKVTRNGKVVKVTGDLQRSGMKLGHGLKHLVVLRIEEEMRFPSLNRDLLTVPWWTSLKKNTSTMGCISFFRFMLCPRPLVMSFGHYIVE